MNNWINSTNLKKNQRRVNKIIRSFNKNIYNDELWKGRFYIQQLDRKVQVSDDHSFLWINFKFLFVDRETGYQSIKYIRKEEIMGSGWRLWETLNDFIVKECKVWEQKPRINRQTSIDYRRCHKW